MFGRSTEGLSRKNDQMKKGIQILALAASFGALVSCSSEVKENTGSNETKDSSFSITPLPLEVKKPEQLTDAKGVVGIFDVPEMLTVSKMDSSSLSNIAMHMSKAYTDIQKDINEVKAEVNGASGVIYYNNDTSNFVFECVVPISQIPKKTPKNSTVVVLEASRMLVYNYYGPYSHLKDAYADIALYCNKNKLVQSGPMREFYVTDPTKVKDSSQWLTRIMFPVK